MPDSVLQVRNLKTSFFSVGGTTRAVDDVSFDIHRGEVFGLVGESGSGKTMTALSILKLVTPPGRIEEGKVFFEGKDLLSADEKSLCGIRGSAISIVFQEPASALNPVFTVGYQVVEAITAHRNIEAKKARAFALEYFEKVHISNSSRVFYDYPHQLSGGIKQRAMIAMALVNSPSLLILDEPTTALDVTVQAGILDLLDEIIDRYKVSVLFISHDFGIIGRMCDRVAVMYHGKIIEIGEKNAILRNPKEPYTISLLESVRALS